MPFIYKKLLVFTVGTWVNGRQDETVILNCCFVQCLWSSGLRYSLYMGEAEVQTLPGTPINKHEGPDSPSLALRHFRAKNHPLLRIVINIQPAKRHFPVFTGVPRCCLAHPPSLEIQRFVPPDGADVGIPLVTGSADAQIEISPLRSPAGASSLAKGVGFMHLFS